MEHSTRCNGWGPVQRAISLVERDVSWDLETVLLSAFYETISANAQHIYKSLL